MTLEQVLNKYDDAVSFYLHECEASGKSERTVGNYEQRLASFRNFFERHHANDAEVNDPGYADFQAWRDELIADGKAVRTVERYLSDLRIFFTFVSDEELGEMQKYEKNPVSSRIIPSIRKEAAKPYDQILTDEQVTLLWEFRKDLNNLHGMGVFEARNYAVVMVLLSTEIRNGELLDLKLSDLDFEYGEIQVKKGKGNKYRCVDFPEIAQTAVRMYLHSGFRPEGLSDDDYLFGTCRAKEQGATIYDTVEWHRGSRKWLSEIVRRYVKRITGVDNVRSHDLRHVGSRLDLHNGVRAEELQAKLGHESYQMTQVYAGKLGTNRKRTTAKEVYAERDRQAERNKMLLGVC